MSEPATKETKSARQPRRKAPKIRTTLPAHVATEMAAAAKVYRPSMVSETVRSHADDVLAAGFSPGTVMALMEARVKSESKRAKSGDRQAAATEGGDDE